MTVSAGLNKQLLSNKFTILPQQYDNLVSPLVFILLTVFAKKTSVLPHNHTHYIDRKQQLAFINMLVDRYTDT